MGLITTLVGLPVTGPVRAGVWIAEQLRAAAEAELYDQRRILAELGELHRQHEAGLVSEAELEAAEEALLQRLAAARSRSASR
jgi:hypothetical protein